MHLTEVDMIVNLLPDLMANRDISIRELSRLTGVTYTTIRAVYHGERSSIKLDVLDSICKTLDLQPGDIYRYVAPGQPHPQAESQPPTPRTAPRTIRRTSRHRKAPPGGSDDWVTWE